MGNVTSRLRRQSSNNNSIDLSTLAQLASEGTTNRSNSTGQDDGRFDLASSNSPYQVWQNSGKTVDDLVKYIHDQANSSNYSDRSTNTSILAPAASPIPQTVSIFISLLSNRQKIYTFTNKLQQYILSNSTDLKQSDVSSTLPTELKSELLKFIHPKLANIWFIWEHTNSVGNGIHHTAATIHERMLPEVMAMPYQVKLRILYKSTKDFDKPVLIGGSNLYTGTISHLQSQSSYGSQSSYSSQASNPTQTQYPPLSPQTLVKESIRINYPYLVTKQTISALFDYIIEQEIFIEDISHFNKFFTSILQLLGTVDGVDSCMDYVERLYGVMGMGDGGELGKFEEIKKSLERLHSNKLVIYEQLVQCSKKFLHSGYPHATLLLYQTLTKFLDNRKTRLSSSNSLPLLQSLQPQIYLYSQIYSLFLYTFNQLNLEYRHLQKMTISNIIHLMLRGNDVGVLRELRAVYGRVRGLVEVVLGGLQRKGSIQRRGSITMKQQVDVVSEISEKDRQQILNKYSFQKQLTNYIFSNYCTLHICLQILTTPIYLHPQSIPQAQPQSQESPRSPKKKSVQSPSVPQPLAPSPGPLFLYDLFLKLIESKFQLVIQNQAQIRTVMEKYFKGTNKYNLLCEKLEEVLEITRLLYMFGVNDKWGNIVLFYCNQSQIQAEINHKLSKLSISSEIPPEQIQQQRSLHLFKAFISKFYISSDRSTKKIILNSKSGTPINVDLSKPQAILQISQYLFDRLFKSSLSSIKDLHQITFQHMLYFYRYDDLKSILSSTSLITKYQLNPQTLEIIVINNILQTIRKTPELKKSMNDIMLQMKILRNRDEGESLQIQSVRALVRLISYLAQRDIQLDVARRDRVDIGVMYWIMDKYADRIDSINFDEIYQQIRLINADSIIVHTDQKYFMTNQLLKFKITLASKAYQLGKKNLGNELIDEISRFNPPWLCSELISIFKILSTLGVKIDKRIYGMALKVCSKGEDLQYLMKLWKEQESKVGRKEKGFAEFGQYFQTGREYLVIDFTLIPNEEQYRNYVAECQFNDYTLHIKKYQIFFVLLGSEPERAFHYALNSELDPVKIDIFIREGMKNNIIDAYQCIGYFFKYYYWVYRIQVEKMNIRDLPRYQEYSNMTFSTQDLSRQLTHLQPTLAIQPNPPTLSTYSQILQSYQFCKHLPQKFLKTYFLDQPSPPNLYDVLFNSSSRKSLLINLREEPMGTADILLLNRVCRDVVGVNFYEICLFSLGNLVNTGEELGEKGEAMLDKVVTIAAEGGDAEVLGLLSKLIQKVFSIKQLLNILSYIQPKHRLLSPHAHSLQLLQSLSLVQQSQQFHNLLPSTFLSPDYQLKYDPVWPVTQKHEKILRNCWSKTNIFVLGKVMYFLYGMNEDVEKWVWERYLENNVDQELVQMKRIIDMVG